MKEFWSTLIPLLLLIGSIVIATLIGMWYLGVVFFAFSLIVALFKINNVVGWFDFGLYFLKAIFYMHIAIYSFIKVEGFYSNENIEFVLIGYISLIECIHNFLLWKNTVTNLHFIDDTKK